MEIDTQPVLAKKICQGRFYDAEFITEYGKIESLRASRYNAVFSVILIQIDGLDARDGGYLEFMRPLAAAVLESVRSCDVVGLTEPTQLVVILPETDYFGSLSAIRKISRAAAAIQRGSNTAASAYIAHATFPRDGRGYGELMSAAARRSAARKDSLWEALDLDGSLFWEAVGALTAEERRGSDNASFDAGAGHTLSEFFIDQVNELVIREAARTPGSRGIAYMALKALSQDIPAARLLGSTGPFSTKVYLVGEQGPQGARVEVKNATPIILDDPRLRELFFTLYLSEETAYALICKESWGATFSCFHSSDPCVVEGLITKLQKEYSLQEQLG